MAISSLGFEIGTAGGDGKGFLPILKYNAQSGVFARIDRVQGVEGWESVNVPLGPREFKAQFDLENLEVGWMDFATGGAPNFVLVRLADLERVGYPHQPTERHKKGARLIVKLASDIGGENRVREFATNSVTALRAIDAINLIYQAGRAQNGGKLPVFGLDPQRPTIGIKTGSGNASSTNYQPNFVLLSWAARGDLAPNLRSQPLTPAGSQPPSGPLRPFGNGEGREGRQAPATGSRPAAPPAPPVATVQDNDFG